MSNNTNAYFPETHAANNGTLLAFVGSTNIHVYPCGRRNSTVIEGNSNTYSDDSYIPFDPEARLNTEYNNTNLSGSNGFTQNFIRALTNKEFTIVLGGYEFKLTNFENSNIMFSELAGKLGGPLKIYANIRLEKVPLYSNFYNTVAQENQLDYNTWILRNQSRIGSTIDDNVASPTLDQLLTNFESARPEVDDYYFSGLSFSAVPLSSFESGYTTKVKDTYSITHYEAEYTAGSAEQLVYSLCILEKDGSSYIPYQPAFLPQIRHGQAVDEVELDNLKVEGYVIVNRDLTVLGNVTANTDGTKAHFHDLEVDGDSQFSGDITADGNITANQEGKLAKFHNVTIDKNLEVADTVDTKNLIASDAQITGDISRIHGNEIMGLVTMKVDESITGRTNNRRLTFFTKLKGSTPHEITRPGLINQNPNP